MENQQKEQAKQEFQKSFDTIIEISNLPSTTESLLDGIFERFWKRLEELQKSEDELCSKIEREQKETLIMHNRMQDVIDRKEELLKASDEVIEAQAFYWYGLGSRDRMLNQVDFEKMWKSHEDMKKLSEIKD